MKPGSMSKDGGNLRNSRFGYYFCCGLVNFKDFIILFRNMWVIYGSWKSWGSAVFDLEHIKNDSYFGILNHLIQSLMFFGVLHLFQPEGSQESYNKVVC